MGQTPGVAGDEFAGLAVAFFEDLRIGAAAVDAVVGAAQARLSQGDLEAMWNGLSVMVRPEDMAWVTTHPIDTTIP